MGFDYKKVIILLIACLLLSSKIVFARESADLKSGIHSKLRDNRCSSMSLDKCSCPEAIQMKAYIDGLLEAGTNIDDIFYKVAKKYSINTILDERIKAGVEKRLAQELGEDRPQIALESVSIDFGKVSRKQGTVKKNIKVHNKGTINLVITNIRASCSCTTAVLTVDKNKSPFFTSKGAEPGWQMAIEPGKAGNLEIILDLTKFSAKEIRITRDVYITSNDPINAITKISIEGDLIP